MAPTEKTLEHASPGSRVRCSSGARQCLSNAWVGRSASRELEAREPVGAGGDGRRVHVDALAARVAIVEVEAHRDDDCDGFLEGHPAAFGAPSIEQEAERRVRLALGLGLFWSLSALTRFAWP